MPEKKETQGKKTEKEIMLKISDIDPDFKYEISKLLGAENFLLCFQCSTLTVDCSIARFSDFYRPRKLIRMMRAHVNRSLLRRTGVVAFFWRINNTHAISFATEFQK